MAPGVPAPWPRQDRRSYRAALISAIVIAALVAGALVTGAVAAYRGESAVRSGQRALDGARQGLEEALNRAHRDGVDDDQLAPIRRGERLILAEPAIPRRLGAFDAGQADHLGRQAAALRALRARIGPVEARATDGARERVGSLLDDFAAAVGAAAQAGLDTSDDEARLATVRLQVRDARTPAAVAAAVGGLSDRLGEVRAATAEKQAADAAAAELSQRHDQAKGALDKVQQLLTQAAAYPQLQATVASIKMEADQSQAAFAGATTAEDFRAVTASANHVASELRGLLTARANAYQDLAQARQTVQAAQAAHIDVGTVPPQLDAISGQLDASGTKDAFDALRGQIDNLIGPLQIKLGIADIGVGKVIVINLDRQDLTAYQDGQTVLHSLVTTGRPALPTPTGTTTVMSKNSPWTMVSDWPKDSPYWYPPSQVQYVLWFRAGGYGIHDAPWRSTYGPGTQAQGSHGCVNVPLGRMATLYNWADVGTRVIVQ